MKKSKKKNILGLFVISALAGAYVLFCNTVFQVRFQKTAIVLLVACIFAFVLEFIVLSLFKSKKTILKIIKIFVLFVINISVFSCAAIYSFGPAIIIKPNFDLSAYNALKADAKAQEITIDCKDNQINGWYYNNCSNPKATVIYFYGNYENASSSLMSMISNDKFVYFPDCNFAVFDYPSYGKSTGKATDLSLCEYATNVYDELAKTDKNIIALGYSLGTGPAVYLSSQRDVKGLILYAPYANGLDLYNNNFDIFHGPLEKLVDFNIQSDSFASQINLTPLIIASKDDRVISINSSIKLSNAFKNASFYECTDIGHNDFWRSSDVLTSTRNYITEVINK